jgi:thioredoxin:protein disulfide reductase
MKRIILLCLCLSSIIANANEILNVNQAFTLEITATDNNIQLDWQIAPGYYLYRDRFKVRSLDAAVELGEPNFPPATYKQDDFFGEMAIYEQEVQFSLPIIKMEAQQVQLEIIAQGCPPNAENCYPPYRQTAIVTLTNNFSSESAPIFDLSTIQAKPLSALLDTQPLGKIDDFLPPDKAFELAASLEDDEINLYWQIKPGYYLYRDIFAFKSLNEIELAPVILPEGQMIHDATYGDTEVYYHGVIAKLPLINTYEQKIIALRVEYQGCAAAGLCYPPIAKIIHIPLDGGEIIINDVVEEEFVPAPSNLAPTIESEQDRITRLLSSNNLWYVMLVFFGFGLLLSLTPCVFPMIPILSGIIIGQGQEVSTKRAFIMSLVYVLAMALTYTILGVLTGLLGQNLQLIFQNPWVLVGFALVFVWLALAMFGFYEIQLPSALQTKLTSTSNKLRGGTLVGVAIMGILSALIVGPCVAAPLAGALLYISHTGDAVLGGLALFSMSIGMGVPLLLIGTSAGHLLPRAGAWMNHTKYVFGVLMLAVAIWMVERILPGQIIMLFWAGLFISSAVYLGIFDKIPPDISWLGRLQKSLAFILLLYGVLLLLGAASGSHNPLQPLDKLVATNTKSSLTSLQFQYIKGNAQLEQALVNNKQNYIMLDFYADWCVSCKEMEHITFAQPQVQALMQQFVLLKTDVTANDSLDKELYQRFNIFGPPAIIFFAPSGQELTGFRLVGFMSAQQFEQHLTQILTQG